MAGMSIVFKCTLFDFNQFKGDWWLERILAFSTYGLNCNILRVTALYWQVCVAEIWLNYHGFQHVPGNVFTASKCWNVGEFLVLFFGRLVFSSRAISVQRNATLFLNWYLVELISSNVKEQIIFKIDGIAVVYEK